MVVNRESLDQGIIVDIAEEAARLGLFKVMSEEERQASLKHCLDKHDAESDLWLFGYGSLMWNPAIHFEESRLAKLHGYHRRFCLWTPVGRGTPENPGLVLGLDRGGSCRGMAFRIAAAHIESELRLIWRREMVTDAYCPYWTMLATAEGRIPALTFIVNRHHNRYAGKLPLEKQIQHIATAEGRLGPSRDYLLNTADHLRALGVYDKTLETLAEKVRRHLAPSPEDPEANFAK